MGPRQHFREEGLCLTGWPNLFPYHRLPFQKAPVRFLQPIPCDRANRSKRTPDGLSCVPHRPRAELAVVAAEGSRHAFLFEDVCHGRGTTYAL